MIRSRYEDDMPVYFIQAAAIGPIKIGFSWGPPERRLASLQTGHYEELRLIGTLDGDMKYEQALHRRFRASRVRGEWYRPDEDLVTFIGASSAIARAEFKPEFRPIPHVSPVSTAVARPVLEVVRAAGGRWLGTATELLEQASARVTEEIKKHRGWPRNARGLSAAIRRGALGPVPVDARRKGPEGPARRVMWVLAVNDGEARVENT
jgi:hypothetical protein